MNKLTEVLEKAQRERFWGNIQIDFQAGEAVVIRRTETIKTKENNSSNEPRTNSR